MNKTYKIAALLCALCLLTGGTIGFVIAATPSTTTWLMNGSLTELADFSLFVEGSNYFLKNGATGKITDSTNSSYLLETALGSGNVSIAFLNGEFDFPNINYIPSNTEIFGLGYPSIITSSTLSGEAIFRSEGFVAGAETTSTAQANITIRNLHFMGQGNGTTIQNGFDFANCTNVKVLDCFFEDFRSYFVKGWVSDNVIISRNIGIGSYGEGFHLVWCDYATVSENIVKNFWDVGIACAGGQHSTVTGNIIEDLSATYSPVTWGAGIDISGARNITVSANTINCNSLTTYGIMSFWYDNIGYASIEQTVSSNKITGASYYGIAYFGRLNQGTDSQYTNLVENNFVSLSGRHGIYFQNTGWSRITGNFVLDSSQEANNSYAGIIAEASANNNQTRITISENTVIDTETNKAAWGIYISDGSSYCNVFNNYVYGQVTDYITDNGIGTNEFNNIENDVVIP